MRIINESEKKQSENKERVYVLYLLTFYILMLMFYISMLKICECFDKFQKLPPVDIVILNTCCA